MRFSGVSAVKIHMHFPVHRISEIGVRVQKEVGLGNTVGDSRQLIDSSVCSGHRHSKRSWTGKVMQ